MGKRFYLGIGILVLFLGLGLGAAWGMDVIHAPAEQWLEQAAQRALEGNMEEAVGLARDAHQRWQQNWKRSASLADHNPMDEVDQLFAEMEVYAQAGDQEHFAACCAQLSKLVGSMADAHRFNWWNFL